MQRRDVLLGGCVSLSGPGQTWRPRNRSRNRNILLSQCHDADTPRSPGRAASAPIISILCYSAQDGGAGSGKGRNSEYFGASGEPGWGLDVLVFVFCAWRPADLIEAHRYVDYPALIANAERRAQRIQSARRLLFHLWPGRK